MPLKLKNLTWFLVLVLAPAVFSQQSTPKATAMSFYKFNSANSKVFNRKNIDARKRWFSDELYQLFIKELTREAEFLKANPTDKPHFGDGLPFQPLDEVCELNGKKYRRVLSYGRETIKGNIGNIDVYFKYPKGCNLPDILYALNMDRVRGRWVIDDIRYFPDNTSLVEDLGRKEY